jgi:hypothetical protein
VTLLAPGRAVMTVVVAAAHVAVRVSPALAHLRLLDGGRLAAVLAAVLGLGARLRVLGPAAAATALALAPGRAGPVLVLATPHSGVAMALAAPALSAAATLLAATALLAAPAGLVPPETFLPDLRRVSPGMLLAVLSPAVPLAPVTAVLLLAAALLPVPSARPTAGHPV